MSHKEFEQMVGKRVGPKVVMWATAQGGTFRRLEDGSWERYDDDDEAQR